MNNAKLQLEVVSPTAIKCGHILWFALDTKLVGKVKALLEENAILKQTMCENSLLINENALLKSNINKAIYEMENYIRLCADADLNYLIDILKGSGKE